MTRITARDLDILSALDKTPLTAQQLWRLSETFAAGPFTSDRKIRLRLQKLCVAGQVRQDRYIAIAGRSAAAPNYYFLGPAGFRLLHGDEIRPHSKYAFSPLGIARQQHTHALAEVVVHVLLTAHRFQIPVVDHYRENALQIPIGRDRLLPDGAFTLQVGADEFHFMLEIDNASEPVRSVRTVHAWERKIQLYDALADQSGRRFRVLVVTTRNHRRIEAILGLAAEKMHNPGRTLFLGISLDDFLRRPLPFHERCFHDHRGQDVALLTVPSAQRRSRRIPHQILPDSASKCDSLEVLSP